MSTVGRYGSSRMGRREFLRLGGVGFAGVALLGTDARVLAEPGSSLKAEFRTAAREQEVPVGLLLAIGYVNTGWEMPPPQASPYEPGDPHGRGAYGVMQLLQNPSADTLGRAASLTGLPEERLKNVRAANVRGGAAVLADIQGDPKPSDINGWYDAVARYGGGPLYADAVYAALKEGASAEISTGERLGFPAQEGAQTQGLFARRAAAGQYPGSDWYGASSENFTRASRPPTINKIVVHTMQGTWAGTLEWFKDPAAGATYHYNISRRGDVGQSVREDDIAWHAGWWNYNKTSVGIGHAGYISNPDYWYTDAMYRSSARLAAYLCRKYRIPVDRNHIIGHHEVPGCSGGSGGGVNCHTDPGDGWKWGRYIKLVKRFR